MNNVFKTYRHVDTLQSTDKTHKQPMNRNIRNVKLIKRVRKVARRDKYYPTNVRPNYSPAGASIVAAVISARFSRLASASIQRQPETSRTGLGVERVRRVQHKYTRCAHVLLPEGGGKGKATLPAAHSTG